MPAYLIVYRESAVRDPAEMQQYQAKARQVGGGWKLTPRVLSPAYQAALQHRKKAADYRVIIVQGM